MFLFTFVVLSYESVNIHMLYELLPSSNVILWEIDDELLPVNWEQDLREAYGCGLF
jgi:hypothetical protein